jgi:amino acid adenylation domain-containing protein
MKPDVNIARLLWDAAARSATSPAIVERSGSVSYDELRRRAGCIAGELRASGLKPGARVAILLERGADAAATLFGVLAAGGTAVVLDEALRSLQIERILEHSGATWLVTELGLFARLPREPKTRARIVFVHDLVVGNGDFAPMTRDGNDIAQLIYTSGSTGTPKGVMISHVNLRSLVAIVNGYLEISSGDRIAGFLPFGFVYGLGQLLCAVAAGAALVVERSPLAGQLVAAMREHGATVVAGVPSQWARLLEVEGFRDEIIPSLRVMTNAGGALSKDAVRALRSAQPDARLFLMYGLTEALRCTYLPPEEADAHPDSIGRAIPGAEVMLVREDGTLAEIGEVAEIVFRGPTVTMGYWHDATTTERVFRANPRESARPDRVVYTGDLARRDDQGLLYFVGRKDRMIKTMGHRIAPQEVVSALQSSALVADAEVVGEPDEQWGTVLVAHVVLRAGATLERLKEYCAQELPRYLRPARFLVRDTMPMTVSGKHDLAALAR